MPLKKSIAMCTDRATVIVDPRRPLQMILYIVKQPMQHNEADHCGRSRLHWGLLRFKYGRPEGSLRERPPTWAYSIRCIQSDGRKPFLKSVHA